MKVWHDDRITGPEDCRVSVLDHGLLYGDGVFEGIRITARRIFRLHDHLARLARSAAAIGLTLPRPLPEIAAIVVATAQAHGEDEAYVRLVVTRGEGELSLDPLPCTAPRLYCIVAPLRMFPDADRGRGLRLMTSPLRRPQLDMLDPQVKSLNYLNNVLAKRDARLKGFDDALILNQAGRVAEASGANVFIVRDGVLLTPPEVDGALPGLTRDTLLHCQRAAGGAAECRSLSRYEVLAAEEVFLAGSGAGLIGVASLDDTPLGNGERPVQRRLVAAWRDYAAAHGVPF
jgi:branched-chain amino acid aminotransferase